MLRLRIKVRGPEKGSSTLSRVALVDTGASCGLVLPRGDALAVGARLVEPACLPKDAAGLPVQGSMAWVRVSVLGSKLRPIETYAFVAARELEDPLIGMHYLAKAGAVLTLGCAEHQLETLPSPSERFLMSRPDLSSWRIPLESRRGGGGEACPSTREDVRRLLDELCRGRPIANITLPQAMAPVAEEQPIS